MNVEKTKDLINAHIKEYERQIKIIDQIEKNQVYEFKIQNKGFHNATLIPRGKEENVVGIPISFNKQSLVLELYAATTVNIRRGFKFRSHDESKQHRRSIPYLDINSIKVVTKKELPMYVGCKDQTNLLYKAIEEIKE